MDAKQKVLKVLIYVAFGLYIADFFMMPLSQNEINIEKLPFHACTSMCVMCFLSYHNSFLNKYRTSFAMLDTENSCGRIAAEGITVCPPCVPVVAAGEIIDENVMKILKMYSISEVNVVK